jgi:hypothetical protein
MLFVKNYFHNLIQTSPRFLLLLIIKTCIVWEGVQNEKRLGIHPNNFVQVFIEALPQF